LYRVNIHGPKLRPDAQLTAVVAEFESQATVHGFGT
jgi:hypothetical protein